MFKETLTNWFKAAWDKVNYMKQVDPTEFVKPLRYLIALDKRLAGRVNEIIEGGYDCPKPRQGMSIQYGNLYNQTDENYGPYLRSTDTAGEYSEKVVDPHGEGWMPMLIDQCEKAEEVGASAIEWDNPDGYDWAAVSQAITVAVIHGLRVIAKNPLICDFDAVPYVAHPYVVGVVVEQDDGATAAAYDRLRRVAGKAKLPIWFVSFEDGKEWAEDVASEIEEGDYPNMWVTWSPTGEYTSSKDIV